MRIETAAPGPGVTRFAIDANAFRKIKFIEYGNQQFDSFFIKGGNLDSLTLNQLAEIYGEKGRLDTWSDVGVRLGHSRKDEIVVVSDDSSDLHEVKLRAR